MSNATIGILLLTVSLSGFAIAIWRFEWMQRYTPSMLYWNCLFGKFPATRIGVAVGFTVGITLGSFCLDSKFRLLSGAVWSGILAVVFIAAIGGAVHDFVLHRKSKGIQKGSSHRD